ncbi:MAG: hypothetical protein KDD44_15205, partial [Bdellovibrionales bacterium]|nr:hypothetical protein [Bdellovibrionales bacterium]
LITATLSPKLPVGVFRSRIVVKTTSESNPVVTIPVFARVEGDLSLIPSDVSFGLLEAPLESPATRTVRLQNRSETPVHVLSLKSNNPALSAGVEKVSSGKVYDIEVRLKNSDVGPFRGQVTITTDHPDPDQRELVLPVYGILARKGG